MLTSRTAGVAAGMLPLLVGGSVLVALGVWDDLRGLSVWRRFAVQSAVGCGLALAGWSLGVSHLTGLSSLTRVLQRALTFPATVLWIVGVVNAT